MCSVIQPLAISFSAMLLQCFVESSLLKIYLKTEKPLIFVYRSLT